GHSRQVLRQDLATFSRPQPFSAPFATATLLTHVAYFLSHFNMAGDGPSATANLMPLMASLPSGGRQVHDAHIVATMQAYGLRRLLTHNTADFNRFGALISASPL